MVSRKVKFFASIACLSAAVIFGFAFVVVKNSLDTLPVGYMIGLRGSIATVFLAIVFWKKLRLINGKAIFQGFLLGTSFGLGYLFQTIGLEYTSAGKSAFITSAYIIITPVCAYFMLKRKMDLYTLLSAVLGFVGIGFISLGSITGFNLGDGLTLISSIGFALQIVIMEKALKETDAMLLTVLMFFFVSIVGWVYAPFAHGPLTGKMLNKDTIGALLYLGIGSSGLALLLQTLGQKYISSSQAALLLGFEAVFGALFGIIFLSEVFTAKMIIGCFLMMLSLVVSETKLSFVRKPLYEFIEKRKMKKEETPTTEEKQD